MNWDSYTCPYCGAKALMGIMSLVARCRCGAYYVQQYPNSRWYPAEPGNDSTAYLYGGRSGE